MCHTFTGKDASCSFNMRRFSGLP